MSPYDRCGVKRKPTEAQLYRSVLKDLVRALEEVHWLCPAFRLELDRAKAVLRYRAGRSQGTQKAESSRA